MREKVVPIPLLGPGVSRWVYRTTRTVRQHPLRATALLVACAAASVLYEANVTHKDRIVSPYVNNHLIYRLRRHDSKVSDKDSGTADGEDVHSSGDAVDDVAAACRVHEAHISDAERLLAQTHDAAQRDELLQLIERERAEQARLRGTAMVVRSGQLAVRTPYWDLRNNERNWSILARDQQLQKDSYAYRLERSRDDDFGRNTYSRN